MVRLRSALVLVIVLGGATLSAHHAITAIYDTAKPITIRGTVVEFQFVNPHPVLTIDVADDRGQHEPWQLEMDNRFELVEVGMSADTFKHGDRVIVTGGPARSRSHALYALRIDRPADGFRYEQVGSSPRVTRTR